MSNEYETYAAMEAGQAVPDELATKASPFSDKVKRESEARSKNTIKLSFFEVVTITQTHSVDNGAVLLSFLDAEGNIGREEWLPKKLCSNLNTEENTIQVWDKFLRGSKRPLLDWIEEQKELEEELEGNT